MTDASEGAVFRVMQLDPGLHLVATPIGAARDITLRALDILASADVLVAEDTRVLKRLMEIHGVPLAGRRPLSYHDHNGAAQRPRLLGLLSEGRSIAYCSDAGTPLVADPGYQLTAAAIDAGHKVHVAPGPSAALAALSLSGLPTDRFLFAGFPPAQGGPRAAWLREISSLPATIVIYESARRLPGLLEALEDGGDGEREAAICREITKKFEEVRRGSVSSLRAGLESGEIRGEIVFVLARPAKRVSGEEDILAALRDALPRLGVRDASAEVATSLGVRKRTVYQLALALSKEAAESGEKDG